jgi:hypothetical protein
MNDWEGAGLDMLESNALHITELLQDNVGEFDVLPVHTRTMPPVAFAQFLDIISL